MMGEEGYIDVKKIMDTIPHRYPFLMVDRVLEVKKGEYIKGLKNVTINEPHFPGHYPGNPIMPGVMMVEALAQIATILAVLSEEASGKKVLPLFAGIEKCRFKEPVTPGDQLILEVNLVKRRGPLWWVEGTASKNGKVACKASLQAMLSEM